MSDWQGPHYLNSGLAGSNRPWRRRMTWGWLVATMVNLAGALPASAVEGQSPLWEDLPRNTAFVAILNTAEETWLGLDRFRFVQLLQETLGITPNPVGLPYLPYDLDYLTYIQPWVGDRAAVALLPAPGGLPASMADYLVMLAPIVDQEAFADYFQVLSDAQGQAPVVETLEQTEIYFWPNPPGPESGALGLESTPPDPALTTFSLAPGASWSVAVSPHKALPEGDRTFDIEIPLPVPQATATGLAIAVLPDTLIAAETPAAIKTYLRYRRGGQDSLASSPQFQRTLSHPHQAAALVTVYGNALELLNYDLPEAALSPAGLPIPNAPTSPAMLDTLQALNFGGTLEALVFPAERGVQFQGRFYYDATPFTFGLTPRVATADGVLDQLPASTFLLMSGRDLAGFWRQITQILQVMGGDLASGLDTVRQGFTALTGLDLDQDIFGWMDGEIALAAFPAQETPFQLLSSRLQMGAGVLLQTSDRTTAATTLSTVDDLLTTFGLGVTAETVNRQPVTSWNLWSGWDAFPDAPRQSFISHGWVTDDTLAIVSGVGTMERVMHPSPHDSLREFPLFRNAISTFPDPNNGYFYVNVGATLALIYQVFDLQNDPSTQSFKAFLGSFSTLSATTAQTAEYIELNALMGLAPRQD